MSRPRSRSSKSKKSKKRDCVIRLRLKVSQTTCSNWLRHLPDPVQDLLEQAGDRLGQNLLNAAATQQAEAGRTLDQMRETPGMGFIPKCPDAVSPAARADLRAAKHAQPVYWRAGLQAKR